jgi:putative acetyltransferase
MIRLVAEYQDQVIGMISMRPREQNCRAHCAGIGMMVHPNFWGQGIGSRLLAHVLDHADHQLGLTRVELQVHTDNPVGVQLYKKFGFVVEGIKRFHTFGDGGWADTYFMARLATSEC